MTDSVAEVIVDALRWRERSIETGDIAAANAADETLALYRRMFPLDFERVVDEANGELDAE